MLDNIRKSIARWADSSDDLYTVLGYYSGMANHCGNCTVAAKNSCIIEFYFHTNYYRLTRSVNAIIYMTDEWGHPDEEIYFGITSTKDYAAMLKQLQNKYNMKDCKMYNGCNYEDFHGACEYAGLTSERRNSNTSTDQHINSKDKRHAKQRQNDGQRHQEEQQRYEEQRRYEEQDHSRTSSASNNINSSVDYSLFNGCNDRDSLTKRYHQLVKIFHPDNQNGDTTMTIKLQNTYNDLVKRFS